MFEYRLLSGVRTMTGRGPGLAINVAGTIAESCCGLVYLVGSSLPSTKMRIWGVNLSPAASIVNSGARAYAFAGEIDANSTGGVGVGDGGTSTSVLEQVSG